MTDHLIFQARDPLFADEEFGIRAGRYRFPAPPGERENPRGWMRMTNLASAFSDQKALQRWLEWKAWLGLREHDHIFDEWMAESLAGLTEEQQKDLVADYAEKARSAAKADEAARRGTSRHKMVDTYFQTTERTGTRSMRAQLDSLLEALDRHRLQVMRTEFKVWHPVAHGTMGTSDAEVMCTRTGQIGILDLKTQRRFWTWQEVAAQLYGYDSAPWTWAGPHDDEGQWIPSPIHNLTGHPDGEFAGRRVALVAHMPQAPGPGQLPVEIKEVDIEYGQRVLYQAAGNVELRSIGKSVAIGRRVGVARPL